ncbi:MAG: hypothetical protein IKB20_06230 [Clostridia bacterium]|nr:hypothetical protein [Clostridia bacterium]
MKLFKRLKHGFLALFLVTLCLFTACSKGVEYFDYVSELRGNILLARTDGFILKVFAVDKESPYAMDGVPMERHKRLEAYLVAPEGDKTCNISFHLHGENYGGEMSYDGVKAEYYYACPLDIEAEKEILFQIEYGEATLSLTAVSVRTEDTLTPKNVLKNLEREESELFASLTDKYGFTGEIYMRLIYEDAPYYYVGLIERDGKVHAFLINAKTGKLLAKRTP